MTPTRSDAVKAHGYTLAAWWYQRSPWTQVFIAAGLLCTLELLVAWRLYPLLLKAVAA